MNWVVRHPNLSAADVHRVIPELDEELDHVRRKIVRQTVLPGTEPHQLLESGQTIFDVLVAEGVFRSKGQARKNWQGGSIEDGCNTWEGVGKRRVEIFVYQPPEDLPRDPN